MTRVIASRIGALLVAAVIISGCSGEAGGHGDRSDSASYGTATLMPAVAKAVGGQEYVHLALGDRRGTPDVSMHLSLADPREFRAVAGDVPGELLDVVQVNDRVYVHAEGAPWTYLPLDDPRVEGKDPDFDSGIVPMLVAVDVVAEFESLVDAVTKVENGGEEEVNGVVATHYVVTVDPARWRDDLPASSMHQQVEVDDPAVLDLWIDERSLPVRWEYAGTGGWSDSARLDYSAWGTPIAVVEPEHAEPVGSTPS